VSLLCRSAVAPRRPTRSRRGARSGGNLLAFSEVDQRRVNATDRTDERRAGDVHAAARQGPWTTPATARSPG